MGTTAMVGMVDTDTAMARGLLTPRPSPRLPPTTAVPMADTDMADTTERGQLRPSPTMAMVDTDTAMARGQLTLTTATPDTDMVVTLTASKMLTSRDSKHPPVQHPNFKIKTSEPKN